MKEYTYELFNIENFGNNKKVSCRVYNLDETQIEVFDFIISKDEGYQAWTGDVTNEKTMNRRKEIESKLNRQTFFRSMESNILLTVDKY